VIDIYSNKGKSKLKTFYLLLDVSITAILLGYTSFYLIFNKNQSYIFFILIEIIIGIYVLLYIVEAKYKKILNGLCLLGFILVGSGYLIVLVIKTFPGGKDYMINFFIILVSLLVAAGVAVFGSIYGAKLGAEKSIEGTMEILKEQMRVELHEKEKLRIEKATYIQSIIATFLSKEMEKNYEILDITGVKNLPIGTNFKLEFDEYEKTKYILLENPTRIVREINKLYSLFDDILNLNDNNRIQDKLKKLDEIIAQKEIVDILFCDVKYSKNV
jgi:hypothetical protein